MIKTQVTCDHCGAELRNYIGALWRAVIFTTGQDMPDLHGCTKEHLGLALAKAFGIEINWKMVDAIEAKNLIIADRDKRIAELETGFDYGILEATRDQRDLAEKRITDLEKQLAAAVVASITEQTKPTKPLLGERARDLLLRGAQTIEGLLGANPESTPERSYAYGLAGAMREHGVNS